MKKFRIFFLLQFFFTITYSQLSDDFSDGNLNQNPEWFGDIQNFVVNNEVLQLNHEDPASNNISVLYLPASTDNTQTTSWEFAFQLDFAPSGSNFAKIYLTASNSDLTGPLEGYYLKLGALVGVMTPSNYTNNREQKKPFYLVVPLVPLALPLQLEKSE